MHAIAATQLGSRGQRTAGRLIDASHHVCATLGWKGSLELVRGTSVLCILGTEVSWHRAAETKRGGTVFETHTGGPLGRRSQ